MWQRTTYTFRLRYQRIAKGGEIVRVLATTINEEKDCVYLQGKDSIHGKTDSIHSNECTSTTYINHEIKSTELK
jgi:hypothetical protein